MYVSSSINGDDISLLIFLPSALPNEPLNVNNLFSCFNDVSVRVNAGLASLFLNYHYFFYNFLDTNECLSNPCKNGNCSDLYGSYSCKLFLIINAYF